MRIGLLLGIFAVVPVAALAQPVKPVKLVTVTEAQPVLERSFFGKVVARQTVDLAFQVGGQIIDLPAIEGETIPEGELIAELDLVPFELAVEQARLQKEQADRTLRRLSQLSGSTVSEVSVNDAETTAALSAIALRNAEISLRDASLRAPFDALVAARNVANFSTIAAGTPIVRIHDMSEIRIEIDVPEILFQRAGADPDVALFALFPALDGIFPLEVREFNAETSEIGQSYRITLGMPRPDNLAILPGASVTVKVRQRVADRGIIVPGSAIGVAPDGSYFVKVFEPGADADGGTIRTQPVDVTPGARGEFVVASGLGGGEEIVAAGVQRLQDGQSVRRFTGFPD